MALTFTQRSAVHSTTTATSYATTAAFTPAANSLMIAVVRYVSSAVAPTSVQTTNTTNRYTFAQVYNNGSGSAYFGIWVANSGATPPNDTITAVTPSVSGAHVTVCEVTGADLSGTALQAIVANATTTNGTGTTGAITFADPTSADNRPFAAFVHVANEATTFRTNWTELDDGNFANPSDGLETQYRSDTFETTGSATWATSVGWTALGVEVKAAASGVTGTGAITAAAASLSGTGAEEFAGAGDLTASAASFEGTGTSIEAVTGTGDFAAAPASFGGVGTQTVTPPIITGKPRKKKKPLEFLPVPLLPVKGKGDFRAAPASLHGVGEVGPDPRIRDDEELLLLSLP